jgi:hypothetical protein
MDALFSPSVRVIGEPGRYFSLRARQSLGHCHPYRTRSLIDEGGIIERILSLMNLWNKKIRTNRSTFASTICLEATNDKQVAVNMQRMTSEQEGECVRLLH